MLDSQLNPLLGYHDIEMSATQIIQSNVATRRQDRKKSDIVWRHILPPHPAKHLNSFQAKAMQRESSDHRCLVHNALLLHALKHLHRRRTRI
jgi:hypothetical protein